MWETEYVGDNFEMLVTDLLHWKSHHYDFVTIIKSSTSLSSRNHFEITDNFLSNFWYFFQKWLVREFLPEIKFLKQWPGFHYLDEYRVVIDNYQFLDQHVTDNWFANQSDVFISLFSIDFISIHNFEFLDMTLRLAASHWQ